MAWVTEYDMKWIGNHMAGNIFIQRDGGSYQGDLKLKRGSLEINTDLGGWDNQIFKTYCRFTITNYTGTEAGFYAMIPLMTIESGQYRVIVEMDIDSGDPVQLFVGYLNCEAVSQDMLQYSELTLTASGLVDKLQYIEPNGILEPVENKSMIDLIDYCLRETGGYYNIRVMCSLNETGAASGSGRGLFNEIGVSTELFWQDNIKRDNALDIIGTILKSFNSYLYWYDGYWYIDYYEDLGNTNRTYIEYTTGTSYGPLEGGTVQAVSSSSLQVHRVDNPPEPVPTWQVGGTQTLTVNPGVHQVDITFDQNQFFNLMNGDLTLATIGTNADAVRIRKWHAYSGAGGPLWEDPGYPYKNITNSIIRVGWNAIAADFQFNGLNTRFLVTVHESGELTIKFKMSIISVPSSVQRFFQFPEEYDVKLYWWLRYEEPEYSTINYFALDPESSAGAWSMNGSTNPENYFLVNGVEFDPSAGRFVKEFEIVCPIGGDLLGLVDSTTEPRDFQLNFRVGHPLIVELDPPYSETNIQRLAFGDFEASISGDPENNLLRGIVTTNSFLEKKEIRLKLFDTANWNFRNTLLKDRYGIREFINKTEEWNDDAGGSAGSLADKLIESKFRLYRIGRQRITMDVIRTVITGTYRPGQIWLDDKQANKKFALLKDNHRPEEDRHSVELYEYDDSEIVNLVDYS